MSNGPELAPDRVQEQLQRLLASQGFVRSERHSRFLAYIVEEALQGRMNRLKGYTIGIDVFDRDAAFDPNVDSIVRVEAGRLRAKLREYFREEGRADPLIIDLPKGTYVPVFYLNKTPQAPASHGGSFEDWISSRMPTVSLGVVPLINLSGDATQEYLSDGLTEALTNTLSKSPALRIISMTTMSGYKNSGKAAKQIARELNVTHILEGSVLRQGETVTVNVQLIDGAADFDVWAENYIRPLENLISMQRELAGSITAALTKELQPEGDFHGTLSRGALEAYLLARRFRNELTVDSYHKAQEQFKKAVELDPNFAAAYTGLASCYCALGSHGFEVEDPRMLIPKGIACAQTALMLDEQQPETHAFMGIMLLKYSWDWVGAEYSFKRALELSPNDPRATMQYSMFFESLARHNEAIRLARAAQTVDPRSKAVLLNLAWQLYQGNVLDEAEAAYRELLHLYPQFWGGHWGMALLQLEQGAREDIIRNLQRAVLLSGGYPLAYQSLGHYYGSIGQKDQALKILRELELKAANAYVSPFCFAIIHAGLGNTDQCFDWLEKAYEMRSRSLAWLGVTRELRPYHGEPRYQALVKNIGIPAA